MIYIDQVIIMVHVDVDYYGITSFWKSMYSSASLLSSLINTISDEGIFARNKIIKLNIIMRVWNMKIKEYSTNLKVTGKHLSIFSFINWEVSNKIIARNPIIVLNISLLFLSLIFRTLEKSLNIYDGLLCFLIIWDEYTIL